MRLLQPDVLIGKLWKERNRLEDEVHMKLGGENVVVAVVILLNSPVTKLLVASRWEGTSPLTITYVGSVPSSPA